MTRITKRSVDALKSGEKDKYIWDSGDGCIPGFGVKCTPAGRKVFLFQYRSIAGKTRRVTIGPYGEAMSPDQARKMASGHYGALKSGNDPAEARKQARADALATTTFDQAKKRFVEEHVDVLLSDRSQSEYKRALSSVVSGALGTKPINEVRRADISKIHHDLRETPIWANRTLAALSKLFSWCEMQELRPDGSNPCRHIQRYPETRRERFLSGAELRALGKAIRETEVNPYAKAAIRLLLFSGARMSEILSLRWEWVDIKAASVRLPAKAHKTGRVTGAGKTIHLNAPALEVLDTLPRVKENPFVLPGGKEKQRLVNLQKPWRAIRKAASLDDVRLHDLRHSFASVGAGGGASLQIVGALLGHSQPNTTARYAHLAGDPLAEASSAIGARIAAELDHPGDDEQKKSFRSAGAVAKAN